MEASELLNRITRAKRSQVDLHAYLFEVDPPLGALVNGCGSWLHLREWLQEFTPKGTNESRLLAANFCKKHLLCQSCAVRRAGKHVEAYAAKVEHLQKERPDLVPAMVTLTVKNGPDLPERVAHMKKAWSRMIAARRRYLSNPDRHPAVEWSKVEGSIRAIEIKRGKRSGLWHPHMHCFVLLDRYIKQKKLSEEWHQWTGDSFVVGVTKCKNGIVPGLIETVKYSCKFSSMTPDQIYYVHSTLTGSRLLDPQGCLRGVTVPSIDSDDISGLSGPYRDFIATWLHGEQRYHLSEKWNGPLTFIRPGQLRTEAAHVSECDIGDAEVPF